MNEFLLEGSEKNLPQSVLPLMAVIGEYGKPPYFHPCIIAMAPGPVLKIDKGNPQKKYQGEVPLAESVEVAAGTLWERGRFLRLQKKIACRTNYRFCLSMIFNQIK